MSDYIDPRPMQPTEISANTLFGGDGPEEMYPALDGSLSQSDEELELQAFRDAENTVPVALNTNNEAHSSQELQIETDKKQKFLSRFGDTLRTLFVKEMLEKGHRTQRIGAFALAGACQLAERGRFMVWALPWAFDKTMNHAMENDWNGYQTSAVAALAVGSVFGAWEYAVGKTFRASISAFPETTEKVIENHPTMVGVISSALNGYPKQEEIAEKQPDKPSEGYDFSPYETQDSLPGKASLAVSRGLKAGLLYGSTAYIGLATVNEYSKKSSERLLQVVSVESATALAAIAAGVSAMVVNNFLDKAEQVRDALTNKTYLIGASIAIIGYSAFANYISRRGYEKQSKEAEDNARSDTMELSEIDNLVLVTDQVTEG